MAQASARKKGNPSAEPAKAHPIIDVIEIKTSYGAPSPGFVLVPAGFRPESPNSLVGLDVRIEGYGGWATVETIAGVRDHGETVSLLIENWSVDFPRPVVGWNLRVPALES